MNFPWPIYPSLIPIYIGVLLAGFNIWLLHGRTSPIVWIMFVNLCMHLLCSIFNWGNEFFATFRVPFPMVFVFSLMVHLIYMDLLILIRTDALWLDAQPWASVFTSVAIIFLGVQRSNTPCLVLPLKQSIKHLPPSLLKSLGSPLFYGILVFISFNHLLYFVTTCPYCLWQSIPYSMLDLNMLRLTIILPERWWP